jgi:hypothetical protein
MLQHKHYKLSDLQTTEIYLSQFWRLGCPKEEYVDSMLGEVQGPGSYTAVLLCHMEQGIRIIFRIPLIRVLVA